MYLNKHLQPHMLDLALNITGLTHDDLFYYKNKQRIDDTACDISGQSRKVGRHARLIEDHSLVGVLRRVGRHPAIQRAWRGAQTPPRFISFQLIPKNAG